MRRKLVAGNWKMHGSRARTESLIRAILAGLGGVPGGCEVVVCPTHLHLDLAARLLEGAAAGVGAQDASGHEEGEGACTGEVSCAMLAELGVRYVITGHSERRMRLGESDRVVAAKFAAARAAGLRPILCVGETLAQRREGAVAEAVLGQLEAVIERCGPSAVGEGVVAYEPVWAIGTGLTASGAQAQEVHRLIRGRLAERDEAAADAVRIIYGGSVKAANAAELFAQPDIDGGLIGGASLRAEEFVGICRSAAEASCRQR